jgi:hypothetical protein
VSQDELDFTSAPYVRGSETSRAAADEILPHAGTLRAEIYTAIKSAGSTGMTRDQLCEQLAMRNQTVCPRVLELIAGQLIVETNETRKTRSGRAAFVLKARAA